MSKKGNKYIDYLDENGWHLVPNRVSRNKKKHSPRNGWKILSLLLIMILSILSLPYVTTYSRYFNKAGGDANIKVATWNFKVNSNTLENININLADTLVENSYSNTSVIPGTKGIIRLNIDFSGTKVATSYTIAVDKSVTVIPDNLKFYSDSNMTKEFTDFSGNVSLDDIDTIVTKNIYWKWYFTDVDETSDWANKNIVFSLQAEGRQLL